MENDKIKEYSLEKLISKSLTTIKKFFMRLEKDNFSIHLNNVIANELEKMSIEQQCFQVYHFIKQTCKEKKRFFDTSKYEFVNLDSNFEKLKVKSGFNQENFTNLIEKCKMLIKCQQDDNVYIEKLKQEIVILESEKKAIIDKTTAVINTMKNENLLLIEKIEKLNFETNLINQSKGELSLKQQQLQERTQENLKLKGELKKVKDGFSREKKCLTIGKDKEIKALLGKLRFAEGFQEKEQKESKDKFKYKNMYHEVKNEIETLLTENNKLACEVSKLNSINYATNENYKKTEKQLSHAKDTIQL